MWDLENANVDLYRETIVQYEWDECFVDEDVCIAAELWTMNKLLRAVRTTILRRKPS